MALKVFTRYLGREVVLATLVMTGAFLGLFAFFDVIAEMRDVGRGGYDYAAMLAFVTLTLPGRAYELLPICVLIGTLYVVTIMARHSEITVLRASGLSTAALLATLLRVGLVFVAATAVLGEWVVPASERAAQQLKLQAQGAMVGREFRTGLWVKDGSSFVNVRDVHPDGSLQDMRIYDFDSGFRLTRQRLAASARYQADGGWVLEQVIDIAYADAGSSRRLVATQDWRGGLTPDVVAVLLVAPERMSVAKLIQYLGYLDANRRATDKYAIALWKKIVYPFACLVMMVLAMPFAYVQDRFGGVSAKVFAGIMLGIGFHLLNGLFSNLGTIHRWSPPLAAMAPSAAFLLVAAFLLWRLERR